MSLVTFGGRIIVLGYGGVSQCTLPLLLRHVGVPPSRVTVVDFVDYRQALAPYTAQGVTFVNDRIVPDRYRDQLAALAGPGDLIIDLAWNIECAAILDWCHRHDVMYVNTSVELWDPYEGKDHKTPPERTLYHRHMGLRRMFHEWGGNRGVTAVLDHGANPGLVSHFTKMALVDIGRRVLEVNAGDPRRFVIEQAIEAGQFNRLARALGVKVIHISERDTQVSNMPKGADEFANTWSVEGFYEEGTAPAEMGWGTHERRLPPDAWQHERGPRNQICLGKFGIDTYVRSRVPSSEIVGMVIRHGEAFSISEALSVVDDAGQVLYRPTVHYAYLPCAYAVTSLAELRGNGYAMHGTWRIMNDDITSGYDEMGVLLMGHDFKSWWCGSILSIEETRRLVPGQNATTLQVAASVLAAVVWMINNPRAGVKLPDELPHQTIMEIARPYLGIVPSMPIDWTPLGDWIATLPEGHLADEVWQFDRFRVDLAADGKPPAASGPHLVKEFLDPLTL